MLRVTAMIGLYKITNILQMNVYNIFQQMTRIALVHVNTDPFDKQLCVWQQVGIEQDSGHG